MKVDLVIVTPANQRQYENWIERLDDAGVNYEPLTYKGKDVIRLERNEAVHILGQTKLKADKWKPYRAVAATILLIFIATMCVNIFSGDPEPAKPVTRLDTIQAQFSQWDGSHIKLTEAIKAGMNDPGSYEHVKTGYMDTGTDIVVTTVFRGKNAFGGKVLNTVQAHVDIAGNILSTKVLE